MASTSKTFLPTLRKCIEEYVKASTQLKESMEVEDPQPQVLEKNIQKVEKWFTNGQSRLEAAADPSRKLTDTAEEREQWDEETRQTNNLLQSARSMIPGSSKPMFSKALSEYSHQSSISYKSRQGKFLDIPTMLRAAKQEIAFAGRKLNRSQANPDNSTFKTMAVRSLESLNKIREEMTQVVIEDKFEEEYFNLKDEIELLEVELQSYAAVFDPQIEFGNNGPNLEFEDRQHHQFQSGIHGFAGNGPITTPPTQPVTRADSSLEELTRTLASAQLASAELPVFSGISHQYINWKQHVQKVLLSPLFMPEARYGRLLKCVEDKPKKLISGSPYSHDAAEQAFRILDKEYAQPERIVEDQLRTINNLPLFSADKLEAAQEFVQTLNSIASALKFANCRTDMDSIVLTRTVLSKIPFHTQEKWQRNQHRFVEPSKLEKLAKFLLQEVDTRRALVPYNINNKANDAQLNRERDRRPARDQRTSYNMATSSSSNTSKSSSASKVVCPICKITRHQLAECPKFAGMNPDERLQTAKSCNACFRCLSVHSRQQCGKPKEHCAMDKACKFDHHPLLHGGKFKKVQFKEDTKTENSTGSGTFSTLSCQTDQQNQSDADYLNSATFRSLRVLRVVEVWIRAPGSDKEVKTVALLDNGCDRTTIDEKLASKVGLQLNLETRYLHTVNCTEQHQTAPVNFDVRGKDGKWYNIPKASTRRKLRLPSFKVPFAAWSSEIPKLKEVGLAEDLNYEDIRVIIGLTDEHLLLPLPDTTFEVEKRKLIGYQTKLGWTVSGNVNNQREICSTSFSMSSYEELTQIVKDFSSTEAFGVTHTNEKFSIEEKETLSDMRRSISLQNGRFKVRMLWKPDLVIPESESQAVNHLKSLQYRLGKDLHLKKLYTQNLKEDEENGYIRRLSQKEAEELRKQNHWFLPHFPAFHPDKPEKPRRVYDAAAKNAGICLNDMLHTGPNNLSSIMGVILRFRRGRVAINADIVAMFSQILVTKDDQNMLASLWQESEDGPIITFVSTRHLFGTKCSPAIANFAVQEAARQSESSVPGIEKVFSKSFYVDDFYRSEDNEAEAISCSKKVTNSLAEAGMELKKWTTNSIKVAESWPADWRNPNIKDINDGNHLPRTKALGMSWDCKSDSLSFSTRKVASEVSTPAEVLSTLASIFDPLGVIAPITIVGKMMMQKFWRRYGGWKIVIEEEDKSLWRRFVMDIPRIAEVSRIPRWYGTTTTAGEKIELHIFTDASMDAFGCVAYFSIPDPTRKAAFVAAKSRLAPSKPTTIPRLELQGFLMGTRLANTVVDELEDDLDICKVHLWTDSLVVFGWVHNKANRYVPFIANRLGEIHEILDSPSFQKQEVIHHYVPTALNPADRISRGLSGSAFISEFQEWISPQILSMNPEDWPQNPAKKEENCEIRNAVRDNCLTAIGKDEELNPEKFNNLNLFLIEFIDADEPTAEDLNDAELQWVKKTQIKRFQNEINLIKKAGGRAIIRKGSLRRKQLILDQDGLLREETRLFNAEFLDWEQKHPLVLPGGEAFTQLVIRSCHINVGHLGLKSTTAETCRKYVITGLNSSVRREVYKCTICRKKRPVPVQVPVAPLHINRLQINDHPFSSTGIDFFGPIQITKGAKRYGLLFMCMTTRGIHLEACNQVDNTSFLLALERFVSRRGNPKIIYCDQGSSFVGGNNELQRLEEKQLTAEVVRRWRSTFQFNPAGAPHWGGSWERMVKEVKKCLYASTTSVSQLTTEAFQTALVRIEAILNRRPLVFDDAGRALCPATILNPASADAAGFPKGASGLKMLRQIQQVEAKFWKDWKLLYLQSLNSARLVNRGRLIQLQVGDKVLVDDSKGEITDVWSSGTIREVHKSSDGNVRSVMVETTAGLVKRSLNRLFITEGRALDDTIWNPPDHQ